MGVNTSASFITSARPSLNPGSKSMSSSSTSTFFIPSSITYMENNINTPHPLKVSCIAQKRLNTSNLLSVSYSKVYYLCPIFAYFPTRLNPDLVPDGVVAEETAHFSEGHSSVSPRVSPVGHVSNAQFALHVASVQLPAVHERTCIRAFWSCHTLEPLHHHLTYPD